MNLHRYPVGTTFTPRGRAHSTTHTVVDLLTTVNSLGEVVRVRYVAEHLFLGQRVVDSNVTETTIAMGKPVVPPKN